MGVSGERPFILVGEHGGVMKTGAGIFGRETSLGTGIGFCDGNMSPFSRAVGVKTMGFEIFIGDKSVF